jgi:PAS domain S-box-containing protein
VVSKPRLSLTAWLALLVLGAVVPLLFFAGIALRGIFQTSRALSNRGQVDTTRALALAVDGEVRSWRAALLALATSRSLRPGRMADFYEEARLVAAQYEGWVVLNPRTGPQQLNTLRPFGAPLPATAAPDMVQAVFQDEKPATDLVFGAVAQRYVISNSIPVFRGGKVVLCLSLNFGPERLTRLLQGQQYPPTWVAAINDSQRRVVARSRDAEGRVGKPVVPWFAAATRAADSGLVTGPMIDGRPGQIAFRRLQEAPWVVALAVPVAELQSTAPIWGFILAGAIVGILAVGLAVAVGRKVTAPVRSLARASEQLLRGEAGDLGPPTAIREVQELQQALAQAAAAARAHAEDRERAAEALRQANEALEARVLERTATLAETNEALRVANATLQEEIAHRREAEAEIRSLARFPAENPNPVLRLSAEGRVLFANAASEAVLHLWGIPVGDQAPPPWPDTVRQSLVNRSGSPIELACGGRTYLVFVAPVPEAGYVNLYSTDITERKRAQEALRESEQQLRLVTDALPVLIAYVDRDRRYRFNNRAYEAWFGHRRAEVHGKTLEEVLGAAAYRTIAPHVEAALAGKSVTYETQVPYESAGTKSIQATYVPDVGAEGEVKGFYALVTDITERKRAEEQLQRTLAELERSNQELEQFAYVASHDLQEPLRMVSSYTRLLAQRYQDRLDQDARDFIGFAVDGATRMQRLIQDLLAYSRVSTRGAEPTLTESGAALGAALQNLQAAIRESAAVVTHDALPAVLADAPQLTQLFQNLVGNALKFRGEAPPRVHVAAALQDEAWVFSVTDNGIGIDPQYFDQIFGIFKRLHPGHRYPGTGIGLALCQRIVERHGGRIWVESAPGLGSTFSFTLRREEGHSA